MAGHVKTKPAPPRIPNPYRRISRITAGIGVLCLGAVFAPSLAGMDMMDAGFGIAVLSGVGALAFFIAAVVYGVLAGRLAALFAGEDLIGCWQMDAAMWREFVSREYTAEYLEKKSLWILMAFITPFAALVFFLLYPEAGLLWPICFPAALLALLWIVALFVPWLRQRIRARSPGWVILGRKAAWIGGIPHVWNEMGCRLTSAALVDEEHPVVELTYRSPTMAGPQGESFRLPLPQNNPVEAQRILANIMKLIKKNI